MSRVPVRTGVAKLKRGKHECAILILSAVIVCLASFLMLPGCVPDISYGQQFEMENGVSELYVINADGSDPTRLGATGYNPRWSPDGSQIAYVSHIYDATANSTGAGLRIVNTDGSGQRTLFEASWTESARLGYGAFWSRDGKRIAFYIWHENKQKIAVMSTDNSELTIVEKLDEPFPGMSGYSPDGKKQAITTETNGIYIVQPDSDERTLVGMGSGAAWSPDSRQIVFSNLDGKICVVNADGSGLTELDRRGYSCAMSPDCNRIVFVVTEFTLNPRKHGPDNLYLMNSDGSNCVRLTSSPTDEGSPAWSPDGRKIVFIVSPESRGIFSSGSD